MTEATAANGTVVINPDGTITYTPNSDFNGEDTVTYTIGDGNGGTATTTVTVTVGAVNDDPVALADTTATDEDTPVTVTVLGNDSDLDGDALTVTEATAAKGTVVINPDGTITYTPNSNFNGEDTITYTISDGNGGTATATVTITVIPRNDRPVAIEDQYNVTEDTVLRVPSAIGVQENDSDLDGDTLTALVVREPGNGQLILNTEGGFEYVPNSDFSGVDNFTYKVNDGESESETVIVRIIVIPENDTPTAGTIPGQISQDAEFISLVVSEIFKDVDGDALLYEGEGLPSGLEIHPISGIISGTIDKNASQGGPYTVTISVNDSQGGVVFAVC